MPPRTALPPKPVGPVAKSSGTETETPGSMILSSGWWWIPFPGSVDSLSPSAPPGSWVVSFWIKTLLNNGWCLPPRHTFSKELFIVDFWLPGNRFSPGRKRETAR